MAFLNALKIKKENRFHLQFKGILRHTSFPEFFLYLASKAASVMELSEEEDYESSQRLIAIVN